MNKKLSIFLRTAPVFREIRRYRQRQAAKVWAERGKPGAPPPPIKQAAVRSYAERFHPPVFIETGTYLGEMTDSVRDIFQTIHTIELDPMLFSTAEKRFSGRENIRVWQGDSREVLGRLLMETSAPALFWLDAHYSGGITSMGIEETPIGREVRLILDWWKPGSVLLIDDARLFVGTSGYPTLPELKGLILARLPSAGFTVEDDIIRVTA